MARRVVASVLVLVIIVIAASFLYLHVPSSKAADQQVRVWVTTGDASTMRSTLLYVDPEELDYFVNSSFNTGKPFLQAFIGDPGRPQVKVFLNRDNILEIRMAPQEVVP